MQKPALAYARCSIDKEGSFGMESQIDQIQQFSNKSNFEIIQFFQEEGVSGVDDNRKGWNELTKFLKENTDIKSVIILRLDRLARDLMLQENMILELRNMEVDLISIEEPDLCSNDPIRKLFRHIRGAISEYERSLISKRLKHGRLKKAETGEYSGGNIPYGYRYIDGKITINKKEAEVVKKIIGMRRKRKSYKKLSYSKIAEQLNQKSILPPKEKKWLACTIHYICKNPLYRGIYKYGGVIGNNKKFKII